MDAIVPLLELRKRIVWNTLRTFRQHSRLKMASIGVLGGIIWISLYVFPFYGFQRIVALLHEGSIADMLVSLFFFLLAIMLAFSSAVIAYTAMFRSSEAWFLKSCPLRPGTTYLYKLVEALTFSAWSFLLLGVPIMLAFGVHKGAPWYYYPAIPVFFLGFVLIPVGMGALIALVLAALLRPWMRNMLAWSASLFGLAAVVFALLYLRAAGPRADMFMAPRLLERVSFSYSVYWPSSWIARGLTACAEEPGPEKLVDAAFFLGMLVSNSLFVALLGCGLAGRVFEGAWDRAHSSASRTRFKPLTLRLGGRTVSSPMFHLLAKDLKTFVRDPVQWTQCAVLFGLLGLYILNLRNLRYPSQVPMWRNLTTFLNLASICLVLATLTTRFVFPMFSLEGRRFWVLGLMPMKRSDVLWGKFLFSFVASLTVTEVLMVTSDLMLREPPEFIALHVFTVAMISLGLSGMAVGLSASYPNLKETSPAKIVSGFGGTLNLILSLLYVSVIVMVEAIPMHLWTVKAITARQLVLCLWSGVGIIVLLAAAAFGIPMAMGVKAIRKMEF